MTNPVLRKNIDGEFVGVQSTDRGFLFSVNVVKPSLEVRTPAEQVLQFPAIVEQSARECYQSHDRAKGEPEPFVKMLIKRGHESTLEHAKLVYRFVGSKNFTHQIVRHRHSSFSQQSDRFVRRNDLDIIMPKFSDDSTVNKELEEGFLVSVFNAFSNYREMLNQGVKAEDARFVLPMCITSKITVSSNIRQIRQVFKLRLESHAQWEIRELHQKLFDHLYMLVPCFFEDLLGLRHTGNLDPLEKVKTDVTAAVLGTYNKG